MAHPCDNPRSAKRSSPAASTTASRSLTHASSEMSSTFPIGKAVTAGIVAQQREVSGQRSVEMVKVRILPIELEVVHPVRRFHKWRPAAHDRIGQPYSIGRATIIDLQLHLVRFDRVARGGADDIRLNRFRNVLQSLRTQRSTNQGNFAFDLVVDLARDAHHARLRHCFQTCSNVDAIPQQVLALHDDIAYVDADAQPHPPGIVDRRSHRLGLFLYRDRTARCLDRTGKLDEKPVAHDLEQPTRMSSDTWFNNAPPQDGQPSKCASLVDTDQTRIADHVGGKNGGKATHCAHFRSDFRKLLDRSGALDVIPHRQFLVGTIRNKASYAAYPIRALMLRDGLLNPRR
jgi:hypothetical protein